MKRAAGYVAAFVAGGVLTAGVAWADTAVQALAGNSAIYLNGTLTSNPPKLVYGDTTYMPIWYVLQVLQKMGIQYSWDGSTLNLISPTNTTGTGANGTQTDTGSGTATPVVGVSHLPYTYTSPNGMRITFNSITADSSGTVINVTLYNGGKVSGDSSLLSTFILANGQFVGLEAQDPQFNLSPMTFYTGGSITGNLTFTALPQNSNQFTVYFGLTEGYSTDRQSVTFDLKQ